jgi:hypothetical protein
MSQDGTILGRGLRRKLCVCCVTLGVGSERCARIITTGGFYIDASVSVIGLPGNHTIFNILEIWCWSILEVKVLSCCGTFEN